MDKEVIKNLTEDVVRGYFNGGDIIELINNAKRKLSISSININRNNDKWIVR